MPEAFRRCECHRYAYLRSALDEDEFRVQGASTMALHVLLSLSRRNCVNVWRGIRRLGLLSGRGFVSRRASRADIARFAFATVSHRWVTSMVRLRTARGQSLTWSISLRWSEYRNVVALARDADQLFISTVPRRDASIAAARWHLTARCVAKRAPASFITLLGSLPRPGG
jgi:hypothetical protein